MEKERLYQLELFSDPDCVGDSVPKASGAFMQYLRSYEKAVLFIILVLVVAVAAFSIGVERGKKSVIIQAPLAVRQAKTPMPVRQLKSKAYVITTNNLVNTGKAVPLGSTAVRKPPGVPQPQQAAIRLNSNGSTIKGKYTIQLGTYRSKSQAGKEADALRRKGGVPVVVFKDPFYLLSLGNFTDKRSAELWLLKLKKQYKDSFIRRL